MSYARSPCKEAAQALIIEPDGQGGWLSRQDLELMQKLRELQELFNRGKDEQIQKEEQARVAAEAQLETMRELTDQSREFAQSATTAMESMARMKIGIDSDTFAAELDKLVGLINQRDDAKLRVKIISEEIDALKVAEKAGEALAKTPIKAPVEFDLRNLLDKDLEDVVAKVQGAEIPVAVTPEIEDGATQALTNDLARTPATATVNVAVNADAVESELDNLGRLTQEREAWVQVRAGTEQAIADLSDFQAMVASTQSTHTIVTNANQALAEILSLNGRNTSSTHTIYVQRVETDAVGGLVGLADGGFPRRRGYITGPGTDTSDSIPAMLSRGEFVLRAAAVRKWGLGFLYALNRGFMPAVPRLAMGGAVTPAPALQGGLPEMAINLSVQGGQPLRLLSSRETARNLTNALRDLQRGR